MSVDRKKLLEGRAEAKRALSDPDLPQPIREKYKKALDHAEAALLMDDTTRPAAHAAVKKSGQALQDHQRRWRKHGRSWRNRRRGRGTSRWRK